MERGGGGLADGKAGRKHDWWQQPLEPLAGFGQFSRDDRKRPAGLGPDVTCNEADDPLGFLRCQDHAGVGPSGTMAIEP